MYPSNLMKRSSGGFSLLVYWHSWGVHFDEQCFFSVQLSRKCTTFGLDTRQKRYQILHVKSVWLCSMTTQFLVAALSYINYILIWCTSTFRRKIQRLIVYFSSSELKLAWNVRSRRITNWSWLDPFYIKMNQQISWWTSWLTLFSFAWSQTVDRSFNCFFVGLHLEYIAGFPANTIERVDCSLLS